MASSAIVVYFIAILQALSTTSSELTVAPHLESLKPTSVSHHVSSIITTSPLAEASSLLPSPTVAPLKSKISAVNQPTKASQPDMTITILPSPTFLMSLDTSPSTPAIHTTVQSTTSPNVFDDVTSPELNTSTTEHSAATESVTESSTSLNNMVFDEVTLPSTTEYSATDESTTQSSTLLPIASTEPPSNVRLRGGCSFFEGRVEVFVDGRWGTVCDDFWGEMDAQVVCNQLGYPGPGQAFLQAAFGQGSGDIILDDVNCVGDEQSLLDCQANQRHNCRHTEDAGVKCTSDCSCENIIRLTETYNYYEGLIEYCYDGTWQKLVLCDDSWDTLDADVVCTQLGFSNGSSAISVSAFQNGDFEVAFSSLSCGGTESALSDCTSTRMIDCGPSSAVAARAACAVSNETTFIQFGPEAGDNVTFLEDGNFTILEPLMLNTPIVFYLRKYRQLFVTSNGAISFQKLNNTSDILQQTATIPLIAPQWALNSEYATIYSRVTSDESTLQQVRGILIGRNEKFRTFQPSLAVVITWISTRQEALQFILSTGRRASFLSFIFNDGEGIRALSAGSVHFSAGDQLRSHTLQATTASFETLRNTLNSFRIDGDCVIDVSTTSICGEDPYVYSCPTNTGCRCYMSLPDDVLEEHVSESSCVAGTEPLLNSGILNCRPVLFCVPSQCPNATSQLSCFPNSTGFLVFGQGTTGPQADDASTPAISLNVPVVYFRKQQNLSFVSTNGLLSFERAFVSHQPRSTNIGIPILAPIWTDFNFFGGGAIYYRTAQDSATLDRVASMIAGVNLMLSDYHPSLALIVTWFRGPLFRSDGILRTFQVILSTNGHASFVVFIYENPGNIPLTTATRVGFYSGLAQSVFVEFGTFLRNYNRELQGVNIFRIDGLCITTVEPGAVCGLGTFAEQCENFTATNCSGCDSGFETHQDLCRDINECDRNDTCAQESECFNIPGSFSCACKDGYTGDGFTCEDIDECNSTDEVCAANGECFNSDGSFMCICNEGYTGDGFACQDINECSLGLCASNGFCLNTEGNFTCICNPGFSMPEPGLCQMMTEAVTATESEQEYLPIAVASVLSLLVLFLVAAIILVLCIIWRKRRKKKKAKELSYLTRARNSTVSLLSNSANDYIQHQLINLRQMSVYSSFNLNVSNSLIVNSCNLQLGKTIGQGEFGIVYKALLKTSFNKQFSETVAVKTLKGFLQKELVTDLLKECAKMKELNHPNILPLRGVCLDGGPAPYIIMPFMTNGSLLGYLKENREMLIVDSSTVDLDEVDEVRRKHLDMCIQVAKGMEYLASKRLIHRDLAARNCMIDSGFVIKVADFGLSESMDTTKDYFRLVEDSSVKLPVKWLAPECITDGKFSEKTDVWAYGVTCWEVFSGGKTPYPGLHPMDIAQQLERGYRMQKPLNVACTDAMFNIVRQCWEFKPENRPHFSELVSLFSDSLGSMADYFDLVVGNPGAVAAEKKHHQHPISSSMTIDTGIFASFLKKHELATSI